MKRKILIGLLLIFVLPSWGFAQSKLKIKLRDGSNSEYAVNEIRNITFSNNNLVLLKQNVLPQSFPINLIQNVVFAPLANHVEDTDLGENFSMRVYPNPVDALLFIKLSADAMFNQGRISVFSIQGQILIDKVLDPSGTIELDVSNLYPGVYICRYSDGVNVMNEKFIKQ